MRINQIVLLQQKIKEVEQECRYLAFYELETVRPEQINQALLFEIAAIGLRQQVCFDNLEKFKPGIRGAA